MRRRNFIVVFLLRFALIYGLLILPWPGWSGIYQDYYRSLGNAVFGNDPEKRYVAFEPNNETVWPRNFDTLIIMANRAKLDAHGTGPQIRLGLDTRQMGWIPTALFLALLFARSLPWGRRISALFAGLLLTQVYLVLSWWIYIWDESTRLSLVTLTPVEKLIAQDMENTVMANPVGANLFVPVLIFILVTLRKKDFYGAAG